MDLAYDKFMNTLFAKAGVDGIPLAGSFELTSRCTLNCKMCYIHRKELDKSVLSEEKDTAWWLNLAEKAKDAGMLLLLLTGGEPLLRQDFDEIYLACKKMGLLVSVNTNATLIDEKKVRFFSDNPPQRLNITLYGASKETYADLCGSADAYEKTVNAIKMLKTAGVNVKLNYSITPQNASDAKKVYSFAKELDLAIQPVSYMFSPVRACGDAVRLTAEEAAKAHFDWQRNHLGDEDFKKYIALKQNESSYNSDCGERINCRAGLSTFWVTYKGEMTPCGMLNSPCIPIDDFSKAWLYMRNERNNILLPSKCISCEYRRICDMCAAVAAAENGNSSTVPEYACKKAHEYVRLCEKFIKQR